MNPDIRQFNIFQYAKILVGLFALHYIIMPYQAWAAIVVVDPTHIAETMLQAEQDAKHFLMGQAQDKLGIESETDQAEAERETILQANNMDMAAEEMNAMTEHNLEVAERHEPDTDVCLSSMVAEASVSQTVADKRKEHIDAFNIAHTDRAERFGEEIRIEEADGSKVITKNNRRAQAVSNAYALRNLTAYCLPHIKDGSVQTPELWDTSTHSTRCLEASILMSGRRANGELIHAMGQKEGDLDHLAMNKQIELLVGPAIPVSSTAALDTDASREQAVQDMRRLLLQKLALSSLTQVMAVHMVPEGQDRSMLANFKMLSANRFGSPKWQATVSNAVANESTTPWSIFRKQTNLEAFSAHLQLLSYEQSLRAEALDAAMLALQVNPL